MGWRSTARNIKRAVNAIETTNQRCLRKRASRAGSIMNLNECGCPASAWKAATAVVVTPCCSKTRGSVTPQ
jgi:hypothetical protein